MSHDKECIWLNAKRLLELFHSGQCLEPGLALDVIMLWSELKQPVTSDPEELCLLLNARAPGRGYTAAGIAEALPKTHGMLFQTKDGRLVPSPDVTALNDPYLESDSGGE